jgi:hypothetical protein
MSCADLNGLAAVTISMSYLAFFDIAFLGMAFARCDAVFVFHVILVHIKSTQPSEDQFGFVFSAPRFRSLGSLSRNTGIEGDEWMERQATGDEHTQIDNRFITIVKFTGNYGLRQVMRRPVTAGQV